jgi:hypothetical protein
LLSEASIRRAVQHLHAVGDTDLFPRLPETGFFHARLEDVVSSLSRLNMGQYNPVSSIEVLTPKSVLGFRIGHQLTYTDALIYTAAVIENAQGIENIRTSTSGDSAFAYRYDPEGGARLFEANRSYHDWLSYLKEFASVGPFEDSKPVLETDIADFYQRIYLHRIENLLQDAGANRSSQTLINRIIQVCRSKQSFGLPVGSSASRILAEGVLCDTDRMLRDMDLQFTRYVDDYKIIASARHNTHSILCRLAEHLMITEGLSLNVSKTRISDTSALHSSAEARLEDVFSSAEIRLLNEAIAAVYGDEEVDDADNLTDDDAPATTLFLSPEELLDRLDELAQQDSNDLSSTKAVLKVLRQFPDFDPSRLVRDHKRLAYYLPRDFCRAITAAVHKAGNASAALIADILLLLTTPPISELAYARLWLLNLFANGTLDPPRNLVDLPFRLTPLEERQLVFIRAKLSDRAYFRENRGRLGQAGDWLKPALLIGGSCLPADEYSNWVNIAVRQLSSPLAHEFGTWLKTRPALEELLGV